MDAATGSPAAAPRTIRLHADDDVVIARQQLVAGAWLAEEGVTVAGLVPPGHKLAVRDLAEGQPVRRYGQIIGFAAQPV
ncbi:MAG: UxaA family hydrolase, partial [Ramlibacter sp.]